VSKKRESRIFFKLFCVFALKYAFESVREIEIKEFSPDPF